MNEWAVFFLGVIALAAVVQCAFVVVAALGLRRRGAQVGELCARGGHPGGNQQRRGQAQPQMAAVRLGG